MGNDTGYTGHGQSGGLQEHSKGELYPYTVIAVGKLDALQFQVMHCVTGQQGQRWNTYEEAEIDAYRLRIRDMMHA